MTRRSPIGRKIDELEEIENRPFWTISEASAETGIPISTIRSYYRNGHTQAPSEFVQIGRLRVYLYTSADIDELHALRPSAPTIQKRTA